MTGALEGTIRTAPDADGLVTVTLDGFSVEQPFTGCPYAPRPDRDPAPGDDCLVIESDQGRLWVLTYR